MSPRIPLLARAFAGALLVLVIASCAKKDAPAPVSEHAGPIDTSKVQLAALTPDAVTSLVREGGAKATLVNVWASWCGPCREEFPDIVALAREHRADGLRVVFISADFSEDLPHARKFLAEQGVDWPTYLKSGDDMAFIDALGGKWSGALPGSFLYDANGTLVTSWEGKADRATLEERVLPVLHPNRSKENS